MKKIIVCFAAFLPVSVLYAQKNLKSDTLLPFWNGKGFIIVDSLQKHSFGKPFKQFAPQLRKVKPGANNGMPNSLPVTGFNAYEYHFLLSNKNGFDVYESRRDGMFILKPDSGFVSNMPVAGKQKE